MRLALFSLALVEVFVGAGCAAMPEMEAPGQTTPPVETTSAPSIKPAWLTPEKEAALTEVRKILKEAWQVAEEGDVLRRSRVQKPLGTALTPLEGSARRLMREMESIQFRAGEFSTAHQTNVPGFFAFAQLHYGQIGEAVTNSKRASLGEEGALAFVYGLTQAGQVEAAIEVAEVQVKQISFRSIRRLEAVLFALIAREQGRLGDSRTRETLQRARMAARFIGPPDDKVRSLLHVARAQRSLNDQAGSEESLRWALDAAMNAPQGRDTYILNIIAEMQEEHGDRSGSAKTFQQVLDDEQNLKPMDKVQRWSERACSRILRGQRESGMEIFQMAMGIADRLSGDEQVRAWHDIGRRRIKVGDRQAVKELSQRLVEIARRTSDEHVKAAALSTASGFSTRIGELAATLDITSTMQDERDKASALRFVSERFIETNDAPNAALIRQRLSDAAKTLSHAQLPKDQSQADGMLGNIATIQALTGDVSLAIQTLKRITSQDSHQSSFAYPQIVSLLAKQGNLVGARQVLDNVEKKWLQGISVDSALKDLGRAYAETGAMQEGLPWARQIRSDYAKVSILLGLAEGLMDRHGIGKVTTERPELMLTVWCDIYSK